jgi:protein-glutamine gamma-glutamyltransferase
MIRIAGNVQNLDAEAALWPVIERSVYEKKRDSSAVYDYDSVKQLKFELAMRRRIVEESEAMQAGDARFAVFKESRCNEDYWVRTEEGGFKLKEGVLPADAINDIYKNAGLYAFECATAIVIVLYKATLDSIGDAEFNRLFSGLKLRDWEYDDDLKLNKVEEADRKPMAGDVVYFKNPDVDPDAIEWQGENTVVLGDDNYFGHGIGIVPSRKIIDKLNSHRKKYSTVTAYLMDGYVEPGYRYLSQFAGNERTSADIMAVIGGRTYRIRVR